MRKKKIEDSGKLLEHACILCLHRQVCSLPFPIDCGENDCIKYEYDRQVRN